MLPFERYAENHQWVGIGVGPPDRAVEPQPEVDTGFVAKLPLPSFVGRRRHATVGAGADLDPSGEAR